MNKIGILDPLGSHNNPLTNQPFSNNYKNLSNIWTNLPVYSLAEKFIKLFQKNQVFLLISGTGSGKTVLVPKFLLHALNYKGKIAITNPKQIPSASAASFAAATLDVKLGDQVGYSFKGSNPKHKSKNNKLLYCTDGLLVAMMTGNDPYLDEFSGVIIDEAHERNVRIDLLLLLMKNVLQKRKDFKFIIMSATINAKQFEDYYKEFGIITLEASGKPNFPVNEIFLDKEINKFDKNNNLIIEQGKTPKFIEKAVDILINILKNTKDGDILVFLTGQKDIDDACKLLNKKVKNITNIDYKPYCAGLTGSTKGNNKNLAVNVSKYKNLGYDRKIVMSTDVAESSITIDNLDFVIDSGLSNVSKFYPNANIDALEKSYISKASHNQRKGRTGRIKEGTCYNLFTENEYNKKFNDYTDPPILNENIIQIILSLMKEKYITGVIYPFEYKDSKLQDNYLLNEYLSRLITKPKIENIMFALDRLFLLGCLEIKTSNKNNKLLTISELGRAVDKFKIDPKLGRALISSYNYGCKNEMLIIVSMMEKYSGKMNDIFEKLIIPYNYKNNKSKEKKLREEYNNKIKQWKNNYGDLFALLKIYNKFKEYQYDERKFNKNKKNFVVSKKRKGNPKEWCIKNYINYNKILGVKEIIRQNNNVLKQIISVKNSNNKNSKNFENMNKNKKMYKNKLFVYDKPKKYDDNNLNIIRSLLDGYFININQLNKKEYISCLPNIKTKTIPQKSSYLKTPKYMFSDSIVNIFGNLSFNINTKI